MKYCEPETEGFTADSFSSACTVKDCDRETEGSTDSLLCECVLSWNDLGVLFWADKEKLVSNTALECLVIKPLCLALDSVMTSDVGCEALFMRTTFEVELENGTAVAVDVNFGGERRLLRPKGN